MLVIIVNNIPLSVFHILHTLGLPRTHCKKFKFFFFLPLERAKKSRIFSHTSSQNARRRRRRLQLNSPPQFIFIILLLLLLPFHIAVSFPPPRTKFLHVEPQLFLFSTHFPSRTDRLIPAIPSESFATRSLAF